ncbi:hypothetical protein [Meiothermus sp. CFH 77666]|uniref:hypothetical protein n=1 Tax=Meiothermus sp. CFH 77666 TaxID=2817942 RepID=UPI001AA0101A|nr:hypothetical protein [Meiothermus sp. CFH 77666]MBO1438219.1 hypothetical protein [Meiothermus sp. CFH 77666]
MQKIWSVLLVLGLSVAQAPQGSVLLRLNYAQRNGLAGNIVVVGAYQGGRFIEAEKLTHLEARRYQVFGPQGRINQAQGAGGLKTSDICDWNRETPLTLLERRAMQYPAYALSAPWNPQPRAVTSFAPAAAHRQVVAAELGRRNIKKAPNITQALRTDLDGDGREEVILSANQPAFSVREGVIEGRYADEVGDYGLVMVRKLVSDTDLRTFVLDVTYLDKPVDSTEGIPPMITRRVGAILDLDGDGKMEVITEDWVHEGWGSKVWRWNGRQFVKVLDWGCGL